MAASFERMFNPRGVAIVGASGDFERLSGQSLPALVKFGFSGGIYPVNPKYNELLGRKCYTSIASIDGECDLAVIGVSATQTPDVIRQCGEKGIKFAVVLSGGFRETGPEGAKIEQAMLAAAK